MISVDTVNELLEIIREHGAIVYGTGYVAERFVESLKLKGFGDCIKYCAVSHKDKDFFLGYKVLDVNELQEIKTDEVICLAVHESIRDEIIGVLKDHSLADNYIWIHPFQHRLRFGDPIETDAQVDLAEILKTTREDYRIAIRLAAIEQFYNKNDCGYDIYIKAQRLHCDENTARKRLEGFIDLIKSWDEKGFCSDSRPAVSRKFEILDGTHRIALAKYHNFSSLSCDIYEVSCAKDYRNENIDVTKRVIYKANLTDRQMQILNSIHEEYLCLT